MAKDSVTHNPYYTGTINDLNVRELDFSQAFADKGDRLEIGVKIFAGSARFETGLSGTDSFAPDTSNAPVFDSTTNSQFFVTIKNDERSLYFKPAACGFACAIFF